MGQVETFDHTADLGLRIKADSLDDLFRTAAAGVFDCIVANRNELRVEVTEPVALQAETTADLLILWLNELLFRCEVSRRLYAAFDIHVNTDGHELAGTIGGEPIDPLRHVLDHEVKAVTHHGARVKHVDSGWEADLILDI